MGLFLPHAGYRQGDGGVSLTREVDLKLVRSVDDLDVSALRAILRAYMDKVSTDMVELSGIYVDPGSAIEETLLHLGNYLPPDGAVILAHRSDNLVGCGFLRRIRPDAAEIKRLFVVPEARGVGLGGRLVSCIIRRADEMDFRELYLDTAHFMRDASRLYQRFGFQMIDRYPENANPPDYAPFLHFMRLRIPQSEV